MKKNIAHYSTDEMPRSRILVVDDDKAILELLRHKLVRRNFEVVTARDEKEFRERAATEKPDLLILDIWLKSRSAAEIYDNLVATGFDPTVPVIFITALMEAERLDVEAKHGRRYALYTKPFDFEALLRGIDCLLDGRRRTPQEQTSET